jgi:hypothetical protein
LTCPARVDSVAAEVYRCATVSPSRRTRLVLVVALLTLLAICQGLDACAELSIFWRAAVVSWDSPTTQLQDELAVQGIAYADVARQIREHTARVVAPSGRLGVFPPPARSDDLALGSRLTRAPPAG